MYVCVKMLACVTLHWYTPNTISSLQPGLSLPQCDWNSVLRGLRATGGRSVRPGPVRLGNPSVQAVMQSVPQEDRVSKGCPRSQPNSHMYHSNRLLKGRISAYMYACIDVKIPVTNGDVGIYNWYIIIIFIWALYSLYGIVFSNFSQLEIWKCFHRLGLQ